jgi:hypothetical protein
MTQPQLLACAALLIVITGVAVCVLFRRRRKPDAALPRVAPGASPAGDKCPDAVNSAQELTKRCRELQQDYWTFDAEEKERLLKQNPERLSWNDTLRLLHLSCLELLGTDEGQKQLLAKEAEAPREMSDSAAGSLCRALAERLITSDGPYRPRLVLVWQGNSGQSSEREPDIQGIFRNASITHLGALEIIRIDEDGRPTELAFVGLDELRGVAFGAPAVFRMAKLFYDDGRGDEIVFVPLLYAVSWGTPNTYDRDGSMTRFCCHVAVEGEPARLGVGIGHQDFTVLRRDGDASLFGLGSVGEIAVALSTDDQRFEQKCKARGLDPVEVRRQVSP